MSESDTASRQLALALCWLLLLSAVGSVAPIGSATAAGNTCTGITAGNTIDSPGCYVLNATNTSVTTSAAVEISANNVTLHGGGNTLAAGSSTAEAGVLATPPPDKDRITNLTVRNLTVRGFNRSGLVTFSGSNITVENVTATGQVGPNSYGINLLSVTGAQISGVTAGRNGEDGVRVSGGSGIAVTNATLLNNNQSGFDAENGAEDILVRDTNASLTNQSAAGGFELGSSLANVTLENVTAVKNNGTGVVVFGNSSGVEIRSSVVTNNSANGVDIDNSTRIEIQDSQFTKNRFDGMDVTGSSDLDVQKSLFGRNEVEGLDIRNETRDVTIQSSRLVRNLDDGLAVLNRSQDVLIQNNEISRNQVRGVSISDVSSNVTLSESELINNSDAGLRALDSRNIAVEDTNASLNSGGNTSDGIKFINATSSSAENITATANGQAGVGIFAGSANISVSKSRLVANDQAGIAALDSTNVSVRATSASLNTEASFASGVLFINTTEGAIRDATAVGNNDTGVSLSAGTADVTVSGSRLISNRRAGLRALDSRNITVLNTNASLSTGPGSTGVNLTNVTDSSLGNLTAVRNNDTGARLTSGSDNVTVSGGQFIANRQGVDVRNSSDIAVQNASITDSTGIAGVNISESRGVGVQNSDVRESRGDGVRIFESQEVTVSTTDVQNSGTGVEVSGSPGLTISRTNVQDSRVTGILVADSADAAISNVTAENNTESGIKLAGATNSTISDSVTEANDGGIILTDLAVGAFAGATENNTITNVTASGNTVALAVGGGDAPAQNNTINNVDIGTAALSSVDARLFDISERAELPRPIPENWTRTGVQFDISAQQGAANGGGFVDLTVDISGEVNEVDPPSLDLWQYKLDEERWVRTNAEIDADAGTVSQRFNGSCCSPVALLRNETSDNDGGGGGDDGGDGGSDDGGDGGSDDGGDSGGDDGGDGDSIQVSDPIGPGELDDQSESDSGPPLNLSTASTEFDEVRTSGSENTTLTLTNNGSQ
ncbi:MAG: parallel beta-helix repeat protein, partial [Salinirussus sp.]